MATPTSGAMKRGPSQQGRTPGQSHGIAATPPVSTPYAAAYAAAFSPRGPRSSPQQVKKSPATSSAAAMGHPSAPSINFDSPSFSNLQMAAGLDISGLDQLTGSMAAPPGKSKEEEKAAREGLMRLVNTIGCGVIETMWDSPDVMVVAGRALMLYITFAGQRVVDITLQFEESPESVKRHASEVAKIIFDDLRLRLAEDQLPLTKSLENFAVNFERLATPDRLTIIPGLDLFQGLAGIYASLERLHQWELQRLRQDPLSAGREDNLLNLLACCVKSGVPLMNARGCVGLRIDFWVTQWRLVAKGLLDFLPNKTWSMLIGVKEVADPASQNITPVRISDVWISPEIEKAAIPGELLSGPILDWQEPEVIVINSKGSGKAPESHDPLFVGPSLPNLAFSATFDPPVYVSWHAWNRIRASGCLTPQDAFKTLDALLFPPSPASVYDEREPRTITRTREVEIKVDDGDEYKIERLLITLQSYKPFYAVELSSVILSHPMNLINILPVLRQYTLLICLLTNTFPKEPQADETTSSVLLPSKREYNLFSGSANSSPSQRTEGNKCDSKIDVALSMDSLGVPRLEVVFPFRDRTGAILYSVRENGNLQVEWQNVLDSTNMISSVGRRRSVNDLAAGLEQAMDLGIWVAFLQREWAIGAPEPTP